MISKCAVDKKIGGAMDKKEARLGAMIEIGQMESLPVQRLYTI